MALLKYAAILSGSAAAGIALFGATAYLLLVFGPDVNASHFGF